MPHLYPAETITYMKRKGMKLPLTLAVMTDYTCIPFWEETDVDYYIAPHESLIKPCVRRGLPKEKTGSAWNSSIQDLQKGNFQRSSKREAFTFPCKKSISW